VYSNRHFWCQETGRVRQVWGYMCVELAKLSHQSCLLNSACVKSSRNVPLWFCGGTMSLTGGFFVEEVCCNALEMGNGRRARDDGKEVFRLGMIRCAADRPLWDESASGDETKGRDIVIVAIATWNRVQTMRIWMRTLSRTPSEVEEE